MSVSCALFWYNHNGAAWHVQRTQVSKKLFLLFFHIINLFLFIKMPCLSGPVLPCLVCLCTEFNFTWYVFYNNAYFFLDMALWIQQLFFCMHWHAVSFTCSLIFPSFFMHVQMKVYLKINLAYFVGVAGYVSNSMYKQINGEKWAWNLVLTASLFSGMQN